MSLPSIEAEYLAPTTDTGLIPIVTPDQRVRKLRAVDGHVAGRLVKVPLDSDGMPVVPRTLPAHSGPPRLAYTAVGNDDQPQWPRLGYTVADRVGALVGAGLGLLALITAGFGLWVISR